MSERRGNRPAGSCPSVRVHRRCASTPPPHVAPSAVVVCRPPHPSDAREAATPAPTRLANLLRYPNPLSASERAQRAVGTLSVAAGRAADVAPLHLRGACRCCRLVTIISLLCQGASCSAALNQAQRVMPRRRAGSPPAPRYLGLGSRAADPTRRVPPGDTHREPAGGLVSPAGVRSLTGRRQAPLHMPTSIRRGATTGHPALVPRTCRTADVIRAQRLIDGSLEFAVLLLHIPVLVRRLETCPPRPDSQHATGIIDWPPADVSSPLPRSTFTFRPVLDPPEAH